MRRLLRLEISERVNNTAFPKRDRFTVHKNLIILENDIQMNIPYEFWNLDKYRATLAHKVNHSFKNINSEFNFVYHPRFGWIRGLPDNMTCVLRC